MSPDSTTLKTCRTCGLTKLVSEYYIGSNGKPQPDCKLCRIEYSRKYQLEHADKVRENHRLWREKNAEHYRQYHRDWRRDKPHLASNASKKYSSTEKGHVASRTAKANRNARIRGDGNRIDVIDLNSLTLAQTDKRGRLRCWWCGKPIKGTPHVDHKLPLAVGGKHLIGNLCLACPRCNLTKQTKSPAEFAGRLL